MTNEHWIDLVESWKTPKKMETCQKNKDNRGNVKFHKTTSSSTTQFLWKIWETSTMMKSLMHWICSRTVTTARKRKAIHLLYSWQLLKWKTSWLHQQKVNKPSLQLRL